MIILALDTTTFSGSVALLEKKRLLCEVNVESPVTYSERLLQAVDFGLKACGLKISDVYAFALAVGPGSFTGIRIGLSLVKAFSSASGKPVAPVSTLEALASKLQTSQNCHICPLLDAKKNEVYAALFQSQAGQLREIIPQGIYPPDRFFSLLPVHRILHFIGNGAGLYRDKILDYFKDKARFSSRSFFIAQEVGMLGFRLLEKNKGIEGHKVKPLYFRRSQAEEKH